MDAKTGLIYTIAGGAYPGLEADGVLATTASLGFPYDLAWGPEGNLYIANQGENTIVKSDLKTGTITRVAGVQHSGRYAAAYGYTGDGGPAREAKLWHPGGICFDKEGNLFIADAQNSVIRKVDRDEIITTVVGSAVLGYTGDCGPALKTTLNNPTDVFVDADGIMYIADQGNHVVRKVTNDKPNQITGSSDVCINSTVQLTNEAANGTWQSSQPDIATIDATGKVTGVAAGTSKITYTVVIEGCNTTVDDHTITVRNISEAGAKKEPLMVCKGSDVLLITATSGAPGQLAITI